eukprot:TRINITY_DN81907_c0_g1_i1.p1 TRINITY_DN81907_c0_g1~~TRINITY_DN81907_c0_g1_i1.p1  ORF type:complete len:266 (+),score=-1.98 TRINITY_DN81907_c0_g1_i1:54-800(+)
MCRIMKLITFAVLIRSFLVCGATKYDRARVSSSTDTALADVMLLGNSQCTSLGSDFPEKMVAAVQKNLSMKLITKCTPFRVMALDRLVGVPTALEVAQSECPKYVVLFAGTGEARPGNGIPDDRVKLYAPAFYQGMTANCSQTKILMVRPPAYFEECPSVKSRLDSVKESMQALATATRDELSSWIFSPTSIPRRIFSVVSSRISSPTSILVPRRILSVEWHAIGCIFAGGSNELPVAGTWSTLWLHK